jgi:hypothetical protein
MVDDQVILALVFGTVLGNGQRKKIQDVSVTLISLKEWMFLS